MSNFSSVQSNNKSDQKNVTSQATRPSDELLQHQVFYFKVFEPSSQTETFNEFHQQDLVDNVGMNNKSKEVIKEAKGEAIGPNLRSDDPLIKFHRKLCRANECRKFYFKIK